MHMHMTELDSQRRLDKQKELKAGRRPARAAAASGTRSAPGPDQDAIWLPKGINWS